jgi:hypothetical protein
MHDCRIIDQPFRQAHRRICSSVVGPSETDSTSLTTGFFGRYFMTLPWLASFPDTDPLSYSGMCYKLVVTEDFSACGHAFTRQPYVILDR